MANTNALAILAGINPKDRDHASAPTNLHVLSGEVYSKSEEGRARILLDGLVFSAEDAQWIEVDSLGGLEEGDTATILLAGEEGKGMTPLALGTVGGIDRIVVRVDAIEADYVKATVLDAQIARIDELEADEADIIELVAQKATITDLNTATARIDSLETDNANVKGRLTAAEADIDTLEANSLTADSAVIRNLEADTAKIHNLTAAQLSAATGYIADLTAGNVTAQNIIADKAKLAQLDVDEISADHATIGTLDTTYATITNLNSATARIDTIESDYLKAADMTAEVARVGTLLADKADVDDLEVAEARIDSLEADHVTVADFQAEQGYIDQLQANTADIATIRANAAKVQNLTAAQLEADHATIGTLDTTYMHADMSNSDVAWISNGVIANGAISSAMINDVSANKLTAGTINGSVINVTNLNADNITAGTINGQRIGEGSLSLSKLEDDVYTEAEVDAKLSTMQAEIDGAIETWTGTAVPTLQNAPASGWTTTADRDRHVGDVYFVVNAQSQQNGYNYRFTKSGNTYSWQLIKDTDITNALQRLTTAEGKITTFDSDISTLKTDTGTLTTKTQSLETSLGDKADITTVNEISDTVDGHTQSITQLSTTTTTALQRGVEYINGTQTAATGSWTGVTTDSALYTGKTIAYRLPYAGSGNASLQLKDSNGNNVGGNIAVYMNNTRVNTHYPANTVIKMTYDGTYWRTDNYDSNTYDREKYSASVTAAAAISAGRIGVFGTDGNLKLLAASAFDLTRPILYIGTAYTDSALTQTNNYVYYGAPFNLTNTHAITGAAAGKAVYIVGTISNNVMTPTSTVLTCTEPSTADGYFYLRLGTMATAANAILESNHPLYAYIDGKFQQATPQVVTTVNKVSEHSQTIDGIQTTIGSLQTTVATKADNSTVTTISNKLNQTADTVDGHTTQLTSVTAKMNTVANPNLTPWFGVEPYSTAGGYWDRIVDTEITSLGDGWAHISKSNTGSSTAFVNYFITANGIPKDLKSSTNYTFLIEKKNVVRDTSVTGYTLVITGTFQTAVDVFSSSVIGDFNEGSQYIQRTTKSDLTQATMFTRGYISVPAGGSVELDIRISLYEGEYSGPYKPYVDQALRTNLTSLQTDYATFKQTTTEFESTIGTVIDEKIADISVGGRNLLKLSDTLASSCWSLNSATVTDGVATVTKPSSGDARFYQMPASGYWAWEANTDYVVSVEAKSNAAGGKIQFGAVGAGNILSSVIDITTTWKRYEFAFTSSSSVSTGSMSFWNSGSSSSVVQFRLPKLEKGTKATEWSPAPEDMATASRVAAAETRITQNESAISLRATKTEAYQYAQPNLSPFYSREFDDVYSAATNPSGYWLRTPTYATMLEDGWAHIECDNSSGTGSVWVVQYVSMEWQQANSPIKMGDVTYTALMEVRDVVLSGSALVYPITNTTSNNTGMFGTIVKGPGGGTGQSTSIADGSFYSVAKTRSDFSNVVTVTRSLLEVKSGATLSCDIRISLYEGEYAGPYKPYGGTGVYATSAELKVASDSIDLKVSKNDVINQINVSTEGATISASKVNIEGAAIFSSGRLSQTSLNNAYDAKGAAATVQTNLDNLEIGGRNLLLWTGEGETYSDHTAVVRRWDFGAIYGTNVVTGNTVTFTKNGNGLTNNTSGIRISAMLASGSRATESDTASLSFGLDLVPGDTYTFSCDVKTSGNRVAMHAQYFDGTSRWRGAGAITEYGAPADTDWHRYSHTFTVVNDYVSLTALGIYCELTEGVTIAAKNFKMERGNKATDWTPAPEDVDASIETASGNGFYVKWDDNQGTTYAGGEARFYSYDPVTKTKGTDVGWVLWNGVKRTVPRTTFNPNTAYPYNIPIYLVLRLSSATSTTGTIYAVWYNGGWKSANPDAAVSSTISDWTWEETTDIVLASCVEPSAEAQFTDCQTYDPPLLCTQVTTITTTAASAQALATTANTTANNAAPKANAVKRTQRIYWRTAAAKNSWTMPTAWLTVTSDAFDQWTCKVPRLTANADGTGTKYLYLYTCEQREMANGNLEYTTVLLDDTTTIIDGGNIITGSVTANKLNASDINASNSLTIGALSTSTQDDILNSNVVVGGRNILRGTAGMVTGTGVWDMGTFRASGTGATLSNVTSSGLPLPSVSGALRVTNNGSSASNVGLAQDTIAGFIVGEEYTESGWIRASTTMEAYFQPIWISNSQYAPGNGDKRFQLTTEWQWFSWTSTLTGTQSSYYSGGYVYAYQCPVGGWIEVCGLKLEKGNRATDWSPAPEDLDADISAAESSAKSYADSNFLSESDNRIWYATCDTAAATVAKTATITPTTTKFTLSVGQTVNIKFSVANSADRNSITLSVNGTTAKPIRYTASGGGVAVLPGNGYLAAGRTYQFVYDGSYWVCQMNYDSNTYDRTRLNNAFKAAENLPQYVICGGSSSGFKKVVSGLAIDLTYPIAYLGTGNVSGQTYAVASGGTTTAFYSRCAGVNLQYTKASWTGTQYSSVYLKGTVDGKTFTVHSDIFTTTVPMSDDGYAYIPIGMLYSTYQVYFDCDNTVYAFRNGAFQKLDTVAKYITAITDAGIRVHAKENPTTNYAAIDADGMDVVKGGVSVAQFGETARVGEEAGTHVVIDSDSMDVLDGADTLASFGESVRIGKSGSAAMTLASEGMQLYTEDGIESFSVGNSSGYETNTKYVPVRTWNRSRTFTVTSTTENSVSLGTQTVEETISVALLKISVTSRNTSTDKYTGFSVGVKATTLNGYTEYETRGTGDAALTFRFRLTYSNAASTLTVVAYASGASTAYVHNITATLVSAGNNELITTAAPAMSFCGEQIDEPGAYSISLGKGTQTYENNQTAIGLYNRGGTGPMPTLFEIGNGTSDDDRSNAMSVQRSGKVNLIDKAMPTETPSDNYWGITSGVHFYDSEGEETTADSSIGYFRPVFLDNGRRGVQIETQRNDSNDTRHSNPVTLLEDPDGNAYVMLNRTAWLRALGICSGSVAALGNTAASAYKDKSVSFGMTYSSAPHVIVGLQSDSTAGTFGRCSVSAHSVTTTGFTLRFFNGDSSNRNPSFYWIAIGTPVN